MLRGITTARSRARVTLDRGWYDDPPRDVERTPHEPLFPAHHSVTIASSVTASLHPAGVGAPRVNTKILDALVAEGVLQASDHEAVQLFAKRRQLHAEEAIIQMGLLDELTLLKFQANLYQTFFVSTRKLATAPIHESLLKLVPHKLAQKLCIFPVKFDAKAQELSVLTVQPDDLDVLKNIQFATRVPKVRALVGRPAAIQAAIKVHFEGDVQAFSSVRNVGATTTGLAVDRDKRRTLNLEQPASTPPGMPMRDFQTSMAPSSTTTGVNLPPVPGKIPPPAPLPPVPGTKHKTLRRTATDLGAPPPPGVLPPVPQPAAFAPTLIQGPQQVPAALPAPPPQLGSYDSHYGGAAESDLAPPPEISSSVTKLSTGIAVHDYLETLNVLIALLEAERGELRNHSIGVARICRRLCERLGLKQEESDAIVIGAYLHDVGKSTAHHLTALNVAEYEAHRQQARKSYLTPVRIFESVRLPPEVSTILIQLYERFDGQGFPDRRSAKEICLGARVLAIVETYADLVGHAGNPFRKKLSSQEAWDVLAKHKGRIFDPGLVDVFKLVVLGDDLRAKLLSDSRRALIVDSDAEETTVLDLRLAEHGFDVTIARNTVEAENELGAEFDVIISEVDLKPVSGFELLKKLRAGGNHTPFIFHSKSAEGDAVQRGFDLGADDFITKPASPDLVALKVTRVLDGAGRAKKKTGGVSGSLTEMALPDVVQILFHGRKSGKLAVMADGKKGEILFCDGMIFDARFGEVLHEEAFYELLKLREGDFELDPNFRPSEQVIQVSPESLLLEGMRRFDEGAR
jgi:response regulator RpfG family c-di-GMP phosphodiesterase